MTANRNFTRAAALAVLSLFAAPAALAQAWPAKPVKVIVPAAAGGGIDMVARITTEKLSAAFGQQFIAENRVGAGGRTGTAYTAKQPGDGYTLLAGTAGTTILPVALYPDLPYAPLRDFAPVSLLATTTYLMVVNPKVPAKTLKEFLAIARAKPGSLNYATTGIGSPAHLGNELFDILAGIQTTHVPYKGSPEALTSVGQGETQFMFANGLSGVPLVRSGKLGALGVTGLQRSSIFPEIPTIIEGGVKDFELQQFFSLWAVAGTPREVIQKLNAEVVARLPSPDTRARFAADGSEVAVGTPEALYKLTAEQIAKFSKLVKDKGIKGE